MGGRRSGAPAATRGECGASGSRTAGVGAGLRRPPAPIQRGGGSTLRTGCGSSGKAWRGRYNDRMRVEIDGQDVSRYPGLSAVVDQEVGQRSTATVGLALVEGAELPSGGQPSDFDRVRIEHPRQPYRSVALGLSPWLYWPLDDGPGQAAPTTSAVTTGLGRGQQVRPTSCAGQS